MSEYVVTEMLTYVVEADSLDDAVALVYNNLGNLPEDKVVFDTCDVQPARAEHHTYELVFCDKCGLALGSDRHRSAYPPHKPYHLECLGDNE
jgi:hypothetical protein